MHKLAQLVRRGGREAMAFGRVAGTAIGGFLLSRRWLIAALLGTCVLLAVLSLGKPKRLLVSADVSPPETQFDDVKNLGPSGSGGSWFHRWAADAASNNAERGVRGLTLGTPPADESEPPEATRLTRRLDAVRSRQSRGAVLTGKIDPVNTSGRQHSNAPLRPPVRVEAPQTADSSSNSLHVTPESVFR